MNVFGVDMNTIDDNCGICQSSLQNDQNDPLYTLKECKHVFHTDCIVAWFRTRNNRCPLCGNSGVNHYEQICGHFGTSSEVYANNSIIRRSRYLTRQHQERYQMLNTFSKTDAAPKILKNYIKRADTAIQKHKLSIQEYKDFLNSKSPANMSPKDSQKKLHALHHDKWRKKQVIINNKLAALNLPIVPVIIPQYINLE
jgi:uncharacterized protein YchJ